jgi:hypothetical protein
MTAITDLPAAVVASADLTDKVESPEVGQLVVIYSRGRNRVARVTKVGPKRVTAEYTTPSAVKQAWELAAISHEARLMRDAASSRKMAERYEAEATIVERLGLATDHLDGDDKWVVWAELPAEYRAVADQPNNYSQRTIVWTAEQLRQWATDARNRADRDEAKLDAARAHDALPLAEKAATYVQMTTKAVSRDAVWAVPSL